MIKAGTKIKLKDCVEMSALCNLTHRTNFVAGAVGVATNLFDFEGDDIDDCNGIYAEINGQRAHICNESFVII